MRLQVGRTPTANAAALEESDSVTKYRRDEIARRRSYSWWCTSRAKLIIRRAAQKYGCSLCTTSTVDVARMLRLCPRTQSNVVIYVGLDKTTRATSRRAGRMLEGSRYVRSRP